MTTARSGQSADGLSDGAILHFGLENDVMTATDLRRAFGLARVERFRRARGVLSQNAKLTTFDNSFTDRLGLSAIGEEADISYLAPLLLDDEDRAEPGDGADPATVVAAVSTLLA